MANYNNYQQAGFWDWVRSLDQHGAGVDHPAGAFFGPHTHSAPGASPPPPPPFPGMPGAQGPASFPWSGAGFWEGHRGFGPGAWGPGPSGRAGRRGRRHHREDHEERSPHGSRSQSRSPHEEPEGEGEARESGPEQGPRPGRGGRGGCGFGRYGRGHWHRGWGHHGRRGPHPGGMGGFDLSGLFEALNSHPIGQHPWAQAFRQYAEQAGLAGDAQRSGETAVPDADEESTFTPPIDIFSTETAYVLHIALPGAKKEDVGVNWDAEKGVLNLAGVVYRKGDEDFLKTLTKSERKVGVFERSVQLPPGNEEKEEVDGDAITAKLEDGVLVVTVPKVEKEWTEVKKVDIA